MARELRFRFPLPQGLHARPASLIRDAAGAIGATVTFTNLRTGRDADAASALALIATLTREGDECLVRIRGADEDGAFDAMQRCLTTELVLCGEESLVPALAAGEAERLPRALRGSPCVLFGTPAGGGIGRGPAEVADGWGGWPDVSSLRAGSPGEEATRLARAYAGAAAQVRRKLREAGEATERAILEAHLALIEDPELRRQVSAAVREEGVSAGGAVVEATRHFAGVLRDAGSALLGERALDLQDIARLLVRTLYPDLAADQGIRLDHDAVLVAHALGPEQLMALDRSRLKGLVLVQGGAASHTVILARAHGIPCVASLGPGARAIADGQSVIVDGERGLVLPDPGPQAERFYAAQVAVLGAIRERLDVVAGRLATTADGKRVEVAANVGSLPEVRLAFASGAEGIGLFRTELVFTGREEAPSEDEQAAVYGEAARLAGGRPVIVRTLDVGGDKTVPWLKLPAEGNPFLGSRGVRIYETCREVVAVQVRAILRAAAEGPVTMMLPMVSSVEEVRRMRALVAEEMATLAARGVAFNPDVEIGIMVEVPAVAFAMDELAREVDFFSIGTNDLLQYFLAVDRGNERVAHLYDPLQPAFLRALGKICAAARAAGKWIGLCGELGADPLVAPLLVGLGVDEISVGCAHIAAVKAAISRCSTDECRRLAEGATAAGTPGEVRERLRAFAAARTTREVVSEGLVRLQSDSRDKEEAIRELADLLYVEGRVGDADAIEDAVWVREATCSTGVGFGLAIPHCRTGGVLATSVAVASYESGVEWQSADGAPVHMAILIAVRENAEDDAHLRMIAALSRRLMDEEFRHALLEAPEPAEVVALLRGTVAVE